MKTLLFSGLSAIAILVASPASAASESVREAAELSKQPAAQMKLDALETLFSHSVAKRSRAGTSYGNGVKVLKSHGRRANYWGRKVNGRWHGGVRAPNGYRGYRRPFTGFRLPIYWNNDNFHVPNYRVYNLRQPTNGYVWSRYYDDAVLTNRHGQVYDTVHNVNWDSAGGYEDAGYDPRIQYDESVSRHGDGVYARSTQPARQTGQYDGEWNGRYVDADGRRYEGEWAGTYRDEDGREYRGNYRGAYEGDSRTRQVGTRYRKPAKRARHVRKHRDRVRYDDRAATRYDRRWAERCKKRSGIGGAIGGGVIGGIAGNVIAGRGNRTAGTLIGAGLGAIAGGAIEQGTDPCRKYLKSQRRDGRGYYDRSRSHGRQYYDSRSHGSRSYQGGSYGWQQQYYYPAPTITTITVNPGTTTTTTTTTYETEEVVYVKPKRKRVYRAKKRWKPRKKARCQC